MPGVYDLCVIRENAFIGFKIVCMDKYEIHIFQLLSYRGNSCHALIIIVPDSCLALSVLRSENTNMIKFQCDQ